MFRALSCAVVLLCLLSPPFARSQSQSSWFKADWKDIGWQTQEYVTWKFQSGFTASQFWASPGDSQGYGRPYGFEIQTKRGYDLDWYRALFANAADDPTFTWIGFEIEAGE